MPATPRIARLALGLAALLTSPAPSPADDTLPPGPPANTAPVQTAEEQLVAAVRAGEARRVHAALHAGVSPNPPLADGRTLLHLAAAGGDFATVRELLWAGADAQARDAAGRVPLDELDDDSPRLPLRILLRTYAYLQRHGHPRPGPVSRPTLALVMDSNVNYLHPRLAPRYHINETEHAGRPGVDDDANGFIDDTHGWNVTTDQPFVIPPLAEYVFTRHRADIARLFTLAEDHRRGLLSTSRYQAALQNYTNPIAQILGPDEGLDDGQFIERMTQYAHGSHVAGIILENGDETTRVQGLSINFPAAFRQPSADDPQLIALVRESATYSEFVERLRILLLERFRRFGSRASAYIASTGAGAVNMSFGGGQDLGHFLFRRILARYDELIDERAWPDDPGTWRRAGADEATALAFYLTIWSEIALLCHENPDVLFVCAAGNDADNNDATLDGPAYLARLLPNVVAVAAHDSEKYGPASFSNYGPQSVTLAAPGVDIRSAAWSDLVISMSGTSMAAPYVTGLATLIRARRPHLTAVEVRDWLEFAGESHSAWTGRIASGAVLDRDHLIELLDLPPEDRAKQLVALALGASRWDGDSWPRATRIALAAAATATEASPDSAEAWFALGAARLAHQDDASALPALDRALELDADQVEARVARARLHHRAGRPDAAMADLDLALAEEKRDAALHALRAEWLLAAGKRGPARQAALRARELDSTLVLSPALLRLL